MRLIISLLQYLLLAAFLPSISGLAIDHRTDKRDEVEERVWQYLHVYQNPSQSESEQIPEDSPAVEYVSSQQADTTVREYYKIDNSFGSTALNDSDIVVESTFLSNPKDILQYRIFTWDNSKDICDFLFIMSTHGIWVFKLRVKEGQIMMSHFADENKEHMAKGHKSLNAWDSDVFKVLIRNKYLKGGPQASPKNLHKWINRVQEQNGKFLRIGIILQAKNDKVSQVGMNGAILTGVKERARVMLAPQKYQKSEDFHKIKKVLWNDKKCPLANPGSRKFLISFSRMQSQWTGMAAYGSSTAVVAQNPDNDNHNHNDDNDNDQDASNDCVERTVISVKGTTPRSQTFLWDWDEPEDAIVNYQNKDSAASRRPGVLFILLTTKGFWTMLYPVSALEKSSGKIEHGLRQRVDKGLKALIGKEAKGIELIALVSTITDHAIYGASDLTKMLQVVKRQAAPLFGGGGPNIVSLVKPVPAGIMVDESLFQVSIGWHQTLPRLAGRAGFGIGVSYDNARVKAWSVANSGDWKSTNSLAVPRFPIKDIETLRLNSN